MVCGVRVFTCAYSPRISFSVSGCVTGQTTAAVPILIETYTDFGKLVSLDWVAEMNTMRLHRPASFRIVCETYVEDMDEMRQALYGWMHNIYIVSHVLRSGQYVEHIIRLTGQFVLSVFSFDYEHSQETSSSINVCII